MADDERVIIRSDCLPDVPTMAWGVQTNGLIFLSGVVAMDANRNVIAPNDPEGQAAACLDIIEALLKEAGASLDSIIRATSFATTQEAARAYIAQRALRMKNRPAATTVIVDSLLSPGVLLEVEVIAQAPVRP